MINFLKRWKTEGQEDLVTPKTETITFYLKYNTLLIGILNLEKGIWSFQYSDDFRNQYKVKVLPDFPSVNKVYQSKDLFPFFLHRIPSTKQPKVQKEISRNNIDPTNEAALLRLFGLHSISNPFSLIVH